MENRIPAYLWVDLASLPIASIALKILNINGDNMIRKTSKTANEINKGSGITGSQKKALYDLVDRMTRSNRSHGITLKEISRESGLEINAVSGRINDLKKEGMIAECQKRKCSITNRTVMPVTVGSGDVGGPAHSNINDKKHLEETEQQGFGFDVETKYRDVWPD